MGSQRSYIPCEQSKDAAKVKSSFEIDRKALLGRFMEYVAIDTTSDGDCENTPSTERQWGLARRLKAELEALGVDAAELTDKCCVIGKIPSNLTHSVPGIAFLAHLDSSDACPGKASPILWSAYDGRALKLPLNPDLELSPESCPELLDCVGHDIVTSSGDSLLGGDDKAGVAIVMAGLQALLAHPEIPHGPISVCFNPDEEIGRGADAIPIAKLGAQFAYTFDSDGANVYNFETFSADRAEVFIKGVSTHPGSAKGKLVNALKLMAKFINALPKGPSPENTSGRKGFMHPVSMSGTASEARAELILRDFSEEGLKRWHSAIATIIEKLKAQEPRAEIRVEIFKQYRNMRERLERDMRPVEALRKAMRRAGLNPRAEAVRGGTDGSRLTEMGLPTPNIFAGFRNPHSLNEWVSIQDMEAAARTMVNLARVWAEEKA